MKATIKIEKEVELKTLIVKAQRRYAEDATVNGVEDKDGDLMPCMQGEMWCPVIDIEEGRIVNWPKGTTASVHYKVCDAGSYYLEDNNGVTALSIEGDYVPKMMCPKENGYGDYIIMDIDENGVIANWKQTLDGFINED